MALFHIELEPTHARVMIDGKDMSDAVSEVHIRKTERYAVPEVVLVLHGQKVEVSGVGLVDKSMPSMADAIAKLDPRALEAEALERTSMGQSVTATILQLVAEKIDGAQT